MSPIVQARGLCRRFGQRWAYAHIDLEVAEGERVLLIGANGSGKTTLLRSIATLLQPSLGQLSLFGMDPKTHCIDIRQKIGLLSHMTGLYEDLSAADNLTVFGRLTGSGRVDVREVLERVGLIDRRDPIGGYSAGMRRRLSLAHLLLRTPQLTLLDEPFASLDPEGVAAVGKIISQMPGTVIMASHQVQQAAAISNRTVLMESGQIRWMGPATNAWSAWRSSQVGEG